MENEINKLEIIEKLIDNLPDDPTEFFEKYNKEFSEDMDITQKVEKFAKLMSEEPEFANQLISFSALLSERNK